MNIDDLPNKNSLQYPEPITIRVSTRIKLKIEALKKKNKKTSELLRQFIEDGLNNVEGLDV